MRGIYKIEMLEDGTVQIGAPSAGEMFSFVHVTDSHLRVPRADLPWTGELADAMLEVVDRTNAAAPDLVVFTGDMLDSFTPDNIAYIKGIFERFDAPVHFVLGNHDPGIRSIDALRNLVEVQEDFATERERIGEIRRNNVDVPSEALLRDDENGMLQSSPRISRYAFKHWARAFGLETLNYSLDFEAFHLVFFNFDCAGIEDGEMAWLEADIEANKTRPTLLFFHVPLPVAALVPEVLDKLGQDCCLPAGANTDRLFSLLSDNGQILAAFCGHIHFDSLHRYGDFAQVSTAPVAEVRWRRVVVYRPESARGGEE